MSGSIKTWGPVLFQGIKLGAFNDGASKKLFLGKKNPFKGG